LKDRGARNLLTPSVWLRCSFVLFALSLPWVARGGHTLLIPIGVHDPLPGLDHAALRPVSFGVPVPEAANLKNLERIVLSGAEMAQYRPLSTWPDGSVRWLFIDALVRLNPGQQKALLHLTTGQAEQRTEALSKLAATQDVLVDNSKVRFVIPRQGGSMLRDVQLDGRELPGAAVRLISAKDQAFDWMPQGVLIEKNGPVATTVAMEWQMPVAGGSVRLTARLSASRRQSWIKIEISARASEAASNALVLPPLALEVSGFNEPRSITDNVDAAGWRGAQLTQGTNEILVCSFDPRAGAVPASTGGGLVFPLFSSGSEAAVLAPGGLLRREWHVDFQPNETSLRRFAKPLLAMGASPEVYNDAAALGNFVVAQSGDAGLTAGIEAASFGAIEDSLYTLLGTADPVRAGGLGHLRSRLSVLLSDGAIERSLPGEALSIWCHLTGDDCVRALYLEWGSRYAAARRRLPAEEEDAEALAQLLDVCNFSNDASFRDLLLQRAEAWLEKSQSGKDPGHLVLLADLIRLGRYSAPVEDRLLDRLEAEVCRQRQVPSSDRVLREGYLLTGNPQFLEEGARYVANGGEGGAAVALQQLFAAPQRQHVWRDLPLETRPAADGSVTLAWTVPARALRVRLKHAAQPIAAASLTQIPHGTVLFHDASSLGGELVLETAGTQQQLRLPAAAGPWKRHFAARYLERGAALPGRAPEPGPVLPPEVGAEARAWNWSAVLGGVAAVCIFAALLWRARARHCIGACKVAAVSLLFGVCCGCGSDPTPRAPAPNVPAPLTANSDGGQFSVTIAPKPNPIPLNEHFAVEVAIAASAPRTAADEIRVSVDASMPAHGHGLNTAPEVKELGANRFLAEGMLFHMAGAWELYVDIYRGPVRERAVFPIAMRP